MNNFIMVMIKKNATRIRLLYLMMAGACLIITGSSQAQSSVDYLISRFNNYNAVYRQEKTYLVTDRFVYRPGEDLWFKGYVVSGDTRVKSEDFFVRLISDRGDEIVYRRYPLSVNEASGRIAIPRSCIPGKYWLIAYTGWMKNRCPEEAFRKEILISKYFERRFTVEATFDKPSYQSGDTLAANIRIIDPSGRPVSSTSFDYLIGTFRKTILKGNGTTDIKGKSKLNFVLPDADELMMLTVEIRSGKISGDFSVQIPSDYGETTVKFYPEGGSLVSGLTNVMAIKALDRYGLPRQISGSITDNMGVQFATVTTGADGKAVMELIPGSDSLFLILDHRGTFEKFPLPLAKRDDCLIRFLGRDGDYAGFKIESALPEERITYWIAVINNRIVWTSNELVAKDKLVRIPLNDLPGGIMQVSVFNEDYSLIGERLVKFRNLREDLRVQMERDKYRSRQRVSLLVEYPGKLKESSLALSVSLLNLAHPRGEIPFQEVFHTGSCITNIDVGLATVNDIDLIASDYYPVNWNEILAYYADVESYTNKDGLNGVVYDKKDNPAPHAKIRITHFPNFRLYETQTDEYGSFRISFGSDIIDYRLLNVDAYDALGKTSLNPVIDYSYISELQKTMVKRDYSEQERAADLYKYGEPDLIYDLRYGPGKMRKSRSDTRKKYDPYQYANYTDIMDILQDIQPYRLVDNKIIFLNRNKPDSTKMPEAIIVVNGALKGTNAGALNNILPSDITNINISDALLDIRKYTPLMFGSVIEITTIQGMSRYNQPHMQTGIGILNMDREFYSPDYSIESSYSADNRKTLYWNPKILLYKGNSMVVTFYTSDLKGVFSGHITGVDDQGNPVEKTFNFQVE